MIYRDPLDHLLRQALRRWMSKLTVEQRNAVRYVYRFQRFGGLDRRRAYLRALVFAQKLVRETAEHALGVDLQPTASSSPFSGGTR